MKFNLIYLDPPWRYEQNWGNGCVKHHYDDMKFEDIKALPISGITDKDCYIFIWVTNSFIQEGLELCKAWGFQYKQLLTWVKTTKDGSRIRMVGGYYSRNCTEHIILGVKGRIPRLRKDIKNVFMAYSGTHSKKPDCARELITDLYGDLPRIELFATERADGWTSLGNEIDGRDIRDALKDLITA